MMYLIGTAIDIATGGPSRRVLSLYLYTNNIVRTSIKHSTTDPLEMLVSASLVQYALRRAFWSVKWRENEAGIAVRCVGIWDENGTRVDGSAPLTSVTSFSKSAVPHLSSQNLDLTSDLST
jgi:hypothetical protein